MRGIGQNVRRQLFSVRHLPLLPFVRFLPHTVTRCQKHDTKWLTRCEKSLENVYQKVWIIGDNYVLIYWNRFNNYVWGFSLNTLKTYVMPTTDYSILVNSEHTFSSYSKPDRMMLLFLSFLSCKISVREKWEVRILKMSCIR